MASSLFLNAVYAEFKMVFSELSRRKITLVMIIGYPYMLLVFILLLGYGFGGSRVFTERFGIPPEVFFTVSGYLLIAVMSVNDDLLWRPLFDEWMGTLPYIIASPMPRLYRFLAIPLPRLLAGVASGAATVAPVMLYFYGVSGLLEAASVILLGIVAAVTLTPLIMVLMGLLYSHGRDQWRFINILRPLLFILLGVYYPRFMMPLGGYVASALIPSSHVVEVIQRILLGEAELYYSFILLAAATALFFIYTPIGVHSISLWEKSKLREGVSLS
ncbi:MAG: ABC transporter permease [Desulfurococcus sp.]|nr:ABC transporter permease [Desulfurococcus sp.]